MFTSQTSSFQDSIDVEERDDFDTEEITGYIQKTQLNSYYTIYLYQGTRYMSGLFLTFYDSCYNFLSLNYWESAGIFTSVI